ncbi:type II toxin-antitoxin system PemK/MazF family toxin [Aliirhizobium terrae]|uniref:type II toxin-antitoxin system PemK/MazF family toxin n=1 Tax=Terrirhizobium terrae TaxID=2926709 RepID=UPI002574F9EF|nr:type II toxin-antitoxin system PemK/MazF family toxin [Rhizobium sp. CC-CFT758]WJH40609.1 type II toxin-antitoxin system PemK/MazF family toxin [Rhizobium sp. CC-CFT758]
MKLSRGDVVIAVFPGELGKPRPAVILQSDDLIEIFSTVLACPMTTHLIDAPLLRPIIVPNAENGLQEVTQTMVEKISPLRKEVIRQQIGRLSDGDLRRIEAALLHIAGLT